MTEKEFFTMALSNHFIFTNENIKDLFRFLIKYNYITMAYDMVQGASYYFFYPTQGFRMTNTENYTRDVTTSQALEFKAELMPNDFYSLIDLTLTDEKKDYNIEE